jgi:hypothetical protein
MTFTYDAVNACDRLLGWRLSDTRHNTELWEFEYRVHRYMKNVPDADLDHRYHGLVRNLSFLIGPLRDEVPQQAHFLSSWWWLRKRVHMLAEYRERSRTTPPLTVMQVGQKPPSFLPRHPNACDFVVKYGERAWLEPMLKEGRVRLAPAASYGTDDLDEARRDDELNKHRYSRGDLVRVTTQDGRTIPIVGDLRRTVGFRRNYHVLCTANEFDNRLFACFPNQQGGPADACLVIWDIDEFTARMEAATASSLSGCYFHHGPVSYFDPYEVGPFEHIEPGMSKDFSYAYQREYRFLWFPMRGDEAKQALFVNIGSIEGIAGLFLPDGSCIGGSDRP